MVCPLAWAQKKPAPRWAVPACVAVYSGLLHATPTLLNAAVTSVAV